jgi:hypothetical protein
MHTHNGEHQRLRCAGLMVLALGMWFVIFPGLVRDDANAAEKIVVGTVEDVILFPWGVKVPARIDTGAAVSSLDVCEYSVDGQFVTFNLADRCGGHEIRLPLAGWKEVHSAEGSDRRPVVKIAICLGSKRITTSVTLTDRSHMEYPFLVGRRTLKKDFIVDVGRTRIAPPSCSVIKLP